MVTGRLQEKKGYWYVILSLVREDGYRGPKWFSTGLKVRGNKKKADDIMQDLRTEYTKIEQHQSRSSDTLFSDYMLYWLETMKGRVKDSTWYGYSVYVERHIAPYFKEKALRLKDLNAGHIEAYYHSLYGQGYSHSTVWRHHANIHKALVEAVKHERIYSNPASLVERPPRTTYVSKPYSTEETNQLLKCIKGDKLEMIIMLASFYGLRRSEVLGLRWKAIDFEKKTITINETLSYSRKGGKNVIVSEEKAKTSTSYRTLPMPPSIEAQLRVFSRQKFGNGPFKMDEHLFTDRKGDVIKPMCVTRNFTRILKANGLRRIRFHDLRHGCAGMLISNRVPLIEVQHWLGHSNISTTADLYTHLDFSIRERSAQTMETILDLSQ